MKKLLIAALVGLVFASCTDNKKLEKEQLDNLLKVHDKVMGNDELLMKNKTLLDSLAKLPAKDTAEKATIKTLATKLDKAESAMETWMHKFEPDVANKSHDEVMKYYENQKKAIMDVDAQMNDAIAESTKYLSSHPAKK